MKKALNAIKGSIRSFVKDEEGAQVVEYALIIAVVSIALVIALQTLTTGASFTDFVTRVGECLQGEGDCAAAATPPAGG